MNQLIVRNLEEEVVQALNRKLLPIGSISAVLCACCTLVANLEETDMKRLPLVIVFMLVAVGVAGATVPPSDQETSMLTTKEKARVLLYDSWLQPAGRCTAGSGELPTLGAPSQEFMLAAMICQCNPQTCNNEYGCPECPMTNECYPHPTNPFPWCGFCGF